MPPATTARSRSARSRSVASPAAASSRSASSVATSAAIDARSRVDARDGRLSGLDPLHDRELLVLEVGEAPRKGGQLGLERGDVLHRGRVLQPIAVACDARLDDGDVGLEALELGPGVLEAADRLGAGSANRRVARGELGERRRLRQRPEPMGELLQAGVEGLEPQQFLLVGGAGLHVVLLVGVGVEVVIIARPGSPRGRCGAR